MKTQAKTLTGSRYLAAMFAVGLAIGETVLNWGNWQFAPLWIVDYLISVWLLSGFYLTGKGRCLSLLQTGWAFACGVFYMALFVNLDPGLTPYLNTAPTELGLIALMFVLSLLGLIGSLMP